MKHYDAVIIGSGQSGTPLASKLAQAGWQTALIEKRFIGGTCINDGCTPTKAMVASAKAVFAAKQSSDLGVHVTDVHVNMQEVIARKNEIVTSFREGSKKRLLQTKNLDVIEGEASFTAMKTIEVANKDGGKETITANYFFIDTGGKPAVPAIKGISDIYYYNSTTLLDIDYVPQHLFIVGGSYIGLEFGQMFRRFGSEVTIVDTSSRLLPHEDEDIANTILSFIKEEGITVYTNAHLQSVTKTNEGVQATVQVNKQTITINCSDVLIGAGRVPQTEALQLHNTGVVTDERGYIKVDAFLQTNIEGIYALGDVKGGPAFTHISYNDYVVVYKNLLEHGQQSIQNRMVPYCMFTDPQLGRIGLTEQEARAKNRNIKVASMPMTSVARAIEIGATTGLIKAVVDADTKQILGAAVVGEQGGEIMAMLQLAMIGNITYDTLHTAIFAHPTYAEALNNLFAGLDE